MTRPSLFLSLAIGIASVSAFATPVDPAAILEQPTPEFSAEQILNGGVLPGRKASPVVPEIVNSEGFKKENLYHVPPAGVHPRMIFGPEDLPRIRKQLKEIKAGRESLAALRKQLADTIDRQGTWENECFQALGEGDLEKFQAVYTGQKIPNGPPGTLQNPLVAGLEQKAFLALIDDDSKMGKRVATAAATLSKFLVPKVEAEASSVDGSNFWRSIRRVCGDGAAIGYLYDFSQPYMTRDQAGQMRSLLVKMTKGRYCFGMDLPPHWRNWNFMGLAIYFPLISLSIEGEDGFDPRIMARGREMVHDYINYSLTKNGVSKEGIGYHTAGMSHVVELALAMANRGDNVFINDRFRQQIENWCLWAQQPYGADWMSSGDLGTFAPSIDLVEPLHYFYPENPKIDFIYQNLLEVRVPAKRPPTIQSLVMPADPIESKHGKRVDYKAGTALSMPNSFYEPDRGYLFARDGWKSDSVSLQFTARNDTRFCSHDFPDRGAFYFAALGRAWSISSMRETETKHLNSITIDGKGQAYFPTPATWCGVADSPLATFGAVDVKYCYDWRWMKPPFLMSAEEFERKPRLASYAPFRERLGPRYARSKWERDPLPQVVDYYSGYLAGDPGMWDEDSWVLRTSFNPVQRAFRTAGLVRGKHSYALVIDDIQKDAEERLYEWRMIMPNDVDVAEMKGNDLILCPLTSKHLSTATSALPHRDIGKPLPEKGTPMLLVRILNVEQPEIPTYQPSPALETVEFVKTDDTHQNYLRSLGVGKRLVLPSRSVAPDYKVLLFPFRMGESLPVTTWNADKTTMTLECDGVKDEYLFTKGADGRTRMQLKRGSESVGIE